MFYQTIAMFIINKIFMQIYYQKFTKLVAAFS